MRILTLVTGESALGDALSLTGEIRHFNAEVDFRLRFLHIEIEESYAVPEGLRGALDARVERATVFEVAPEPPLEAAARLALLLHAERPDLLVIAGDGGLRAPALAAARAAGAKVAVYGARRGLVDGAMDLGDEPRGAVGRMTGVAREIQ
jgi:hypothetical protein